MVLEQSINGGKSWQRVDSSNQQSTYNNFSSLGGITPPKWSGDNLAWKNYTINLSNLASQSNVQFRFRFKSDATVNNDGAAIDSFYLRDNVFHDLNLTSVISPLSRCSLSDSEIVTIELQNNGNTSIPIGTIIPLTYTINMVKLIIALIRKLT